MKKFISVLLAMTIILSAIPFYASAHNDNAVDGEIIVKYSPPLTLSSVSDEVSLAEEFEKAGVQSFSLIESYDSSLKLSSVYDEEGFYLVKTDEDVEKACERIEEINGVEYAEPNFLLSTCEYTTPTEITSSYQYLDNERWYFEDVLKIPSAWEKFQTTGENVIVAVIDNGFNLNAKDFPTNLWNDGYGHHGWNVAENNSNISPTLTLNDKTVSDAFHGTHVASTIGMASNGIGGLGVSYSSKLMLIKAADDNTNISVSSMISGLLYAANNGADVINMSLGGEKSKSEEEAINYAYGKGCTIVASAGNSAKSSDDEPSYPGAYENVIGVMASNRSRMNELASFSNYGSLYDVAVPGVEIMGGTTNSTDLILSNGTSMASPIVAGLAALYISSKSNCTTEQVYKAIRNASTMFVKKGNNYYELLDAMSLLSYDGVSVPNTSGMIFDSNNGVGVKFKNISVGQAIGELPDTVREGYDFTGWYTEKSGGAKITEATIYNESMSVVYAHWSAKTYTVTLNSNGGTLNGTTVPVQYNSDYFMLPIPQKDGSYFIGWYTDSQFKNPAKESKPGAYSFSTVKIARNHTVYAKWSSGKNTTVHFKDNVTNQTFDDITVNCGESYGNLPTPEKRDGYTFLGWWWNEASEEYYTNDSIVEFPYEHTLYAIWKAESYTVTFDPNGGACSSEPITVVYGEFYPFSQMPIPTLDGKYFVGWFTADGLPAMEFQFGKYSVSIVNTAKDHTLYAKWSDGQNVTVHLVDKTTNQTFGDITVNYGEKYNLPQPNYVPGYTFLGWSEYGNGTEDFITNNTTVITASEHTLYAIFSYDGFVFNESSGLYYDSENKLIYGFDLTNLTDDVLKNAFRNTNISISKPTGKIGTGTQIQLYDKYGTVYDSVTVVIFGDVNGDGQINSEDSIITRYILRGKFTVSDIILFAADINHDGYVDRTDCQIMNQCGFSLILIIRTIIKITFGILKM